MKNILVIITVGIMSLGAVHAEDDIKETGADPSVQEILERDASQADYVNEVSCLSARRMRDTQVLDSRHVAFKMGRDEYYLVQFKKRVLAYAPTAGATDMRNSRLCKFDSLQGIDTDSFAGMREDEMLYSWLYPSDQGAG